MKRIDGITVAIVVGILLASCASPQETTVPAEGENTQAQEALISESAEGSQAEEITGQQENKSIDVSAIQNVLAGIEDGIDQLQTHVDNAEPEKGSSEARQEFLELAKTAEQLDRELEGIEDQLETAYRAGGISREDFNALMSALEQLEDKLDWLEDSMEYTYGIDD